MVQSLLTPDLSHLSQDDYRNVYEPAEDSFLLLDALEKDAVCLKRLNPLVCVELGCGSGVVVTCLGKLLGGSTFSLATDINPKACRCTVHTMARNGVTACDTVVDDMLLSLSDRLRSSVDVLLFNPPYVPCPSVEVKEEGISQSWAGGVNGREVIDRFLPLVNSLLSHSGVFYLVLVKENLPAEVCQHLEAHGLLGQQVLSSRAGSEHLFVYRFSRICTARIFHSSQ